MKSVLSSLFTLFCFFLILLCPREAFEGARSGLFLWFETLLPTLFPFMVLTNLLIHTQALSYITQILKPILCPIFHVSENGSFAILCGFLCGYPMGAKVIASLCREQKLSRSEGQYLLSFCNNTSPMFLLNYVILSALHLPGKTRIILLLSLASPVCISFFTRFLFFESKTHRFRFHKPHLLFPAKSPSGPGGKSLTCSNGPGMKPISRSASQFASAAPNLSFLKLLEESLADASAAILQVGGYVILFSVLLKLGIRFRIDQSLPGLIALSSLEITTGIQLLTQAPAFCRIPCILFLTGFGGVCALFQSAAMIRDSGLSFFPYIIEKLATGLVTSLLTFLFL
nr:nucleoside recognition domain-containing protein [uncultured Mediterraneibacter sp.]